MECKDKNYAALLQGSEMSLELHCKTLILVISCFNIPLSLRFSDTMGSTSVFNYVDPRSFPKRSENNSSFQC